MFLTVLATLKLLLKSSVLVVFLYLQTRNEEIITQEISVQILGKGSLIYLHS